jgi:hypothetical protein
MSVGLIKYKRVAQRLREKFREETFKKEDIEDAVFIECGTDKRTVERAISTMKRLKLLEETEAIKVFGVAPSTKYKLPQTQDEYF